ncbi:hypothetical protein HNQ41_001877 [Texcoconibacillus texcoconensis]|uniref:Uncharacterized protein n=1 Tax=Texcoconibacillus texcoconensis TaxID=1095777 RepID=A0A840QQS5_9BACI|nr:hypothetical protein [Texcoconibacillus texcoconensis]
MIIIKVTNEAQQFLVKLLNKQNQKSFRIGYNASSR